jgi:hypothetical protein
VFVEPSVLVGDATCPRCGGLLWFLRLASEVQVFDYLKDVEKKSRILELIAQRFGVEPPAVNNSPNFLDSRRIDSLEFVDLVMAVEDESRAS